MYIHNYVIDNDGPGVETPFEDGGWNTYRHICVTYLECNNHFLFHIQ